MKKLLILSIFLLGSLGLRAQETTPAPEVLPQGRTIVEQREEFSIPAPDKKNKSKLDVSFNSILGSKIKPGPRRRGWERGHWSGVGVYYNGLVDNLFSLKTPESAPYLSQSAKSIGVTLNPLHATLVHGRRLGLLTGVGFELNNFRFDQDITLIRVDGHTVPDYQYEARGVDLTKSKLFTAYVNIPLLLEVQIGQKQNFFISAGMVGGMNIGHHTKIKADSPELNGVKKSHADLGMRNFHYGYILNIGYDDFALTMTYYQSPIFRAGQGPYVRQVNIGFSVML